MTPDDTGQGLRVGLFTHSTNPRGGVVHVLELAEALTSLGHDVTVHAPDECGRGFFRPTRAAKALIPAAPAPPDLGDLVRQRVGEYLAWLRPRGREFDVYHAHDGISANALAALAGAGAIPGFVRTVHHLDDFADPFLRAAQDRSVTAAAGCLCVSRLWAGVLRDLYGVDAVVVPNGVDADRFTPRPGPADCAFRRQLSEWCGGAVSRPLFLAVGGVERRKNTLNLLRAFLEARRSLSGGTLLVVGGASLLDHSAYRREFDAALSAAGGPRAASVVVAGPLADALMPAAYRAADALAFPSTVEGFGLAVIEAMACGTPVVASNVAPFTEYLTDDDALLVDPSDVSALAAALRRATAPAVRARLRRAGAAVSGRFRWPDTARAHVAEYRRWHAAVGTPQPVRPQEEAPCPR